MSDMYVGGGDIRMGRTTRREDESATRHVPKLVEAGDRVLHVSMRVCVAFVCVSAWHLCACVAV